MSDMRFFSGRPIKGEEKQESGLLKITYADEKKPDFELVSQAEFDTFVVTRDVESEPTDIEKNRMLGLQKASYGLQGDLMKKIEEFNPRWLELGRMVKRIDDASMDMRNKLFNSLFSKKQWEYELTFADVFNKLKTPNWEQAPQEVQELFALILGQNMKVAQFEMMSNAVMALISSFQKQVIEQEFDRPYETIRLGDIVKYIEDHPAPKEEEKT